MSPCLQVLSLIREPGDEVTPSFPLVCSSGGSKGGRKRKKETGRQGKLEIKEEREEIRHCGCVTKVHCGRLRVKWGKLVPGIS